MRCAVVDPDTGLIENVIVADPEEFTIPGKLIVADPNDEAQCGGSYAGGTFFPPPGVELVVTAETVIAERERRLALGFDFDFGDERGIHHIATTPDDMRKWMDEVTPWAQSFINLGQSDGEITISTDKGVVVITAMEWQSILVAAAGYRQPLYAASFALMAMDPIPLDYADNAYWP